MHMINYDPDAAIMHLIASHPALPYTPSERGTLYDAMKLLAQNGMDVAPLTRALMNEMDPIEIEFVVDAAADRGLISLFPLFTDMCLLVIKVDLGRGFFGRRYHYASYIVKPSGEVTHIHTGKNLYKALFMVGVLFKAADALIEEAISDPEEKAG